MDAPRGGSWDFLNEQGPGDSRAQEAKTSTPEGLPYERGETRALPAGATTHPDERFASEEVVIPSTVRPAVPEFRPGAPVDRRTPMPPLPQPSRREGATGADPAYFDRRELFVPESNKVEPEEPPEAPLDDVIEVVVVKGTQPRPVDVDSWRGTSDSSTPYATKKPPKYPGGSFGNLNS